MSNNTPSLSELTRTMKAQTLSSSSSNDTSPTITTSSLKQQQEGHKFQRIILIHSKTGVTIFDYCFPGAWLAKKSDIGGFLASCYQFDATVKGGGKFRTLFFGPTIHHEKALEKLYSNHLASNKQLAHRAETN